MKLLAEVGIVLAAGLILFGIGWKAGSDRAKASQASKAALILAATQAVEARTAERIAAIRVTNQTINGQVRETIRENTIYRDCELPGAVQRMLEAARQGRAEPLSDRGSLPEPGARTP